MLLHRKIYHVLKDRITSGELQPGEKLSKQNTIAEDFKISRVTVQKAINFLKAEDLVYTVKGQGTFVSESIDGNSMLDSNIDEYFGFTTNYRNQEMINNRIISFHERHPDEQELKKLEIYENEIVYDIIRLRSSYDDPLRLEYTIMPKSVIPGITEDILEKSIYQYIQNELQLEIGDAIRKISAQKPDAYDQKYLNCKQDDPILEVEQQVYLKDGRVFEFSQTRQRYDKGSFLFTNIT
jgi:GntR family transcriptional regulator